MPELKDSEFQQKVDDPVVRGKRLDIYLTSQLDQTRSQIKCLIDQGNILVNSKQVKAGYKLNLGDLIHVRIPKPQPVTVLPQEILLDIVYEDSDLVVLNKSKGMVVHPGAGNWDQTLVNALLYHCQDLSGIGGKLRPGIVHRLDKDTTGLLVVAKNDFTHLSLANQIKQRSVKRYYFALVHGVVKADHGKIEAPIGRHLVNRKRMAIVSSGRPAVTNFLVRRRMAKFTLLECRLETGRTHQIRVHLESIKHPIVGDPVYGRRNLTLGCTSQMLHAYYLAFNHPKHGFMEFRCALPQVFEDTLEKSENLS